VTATRTISTAAPRHAVAALELDGIEITFDGTDAPLTVVRGFDLVVAPGSIHCLAGRSGSGKTSLLRVAVGLAAPTDGRVRWGGQSIDELSADALSVARRKHMGYVDQGATAISDLTVRDNVLLPAVPEGITDATMRRADDLLELFALRPRANRPAGILSGGERQRLAIARALLLEPSTIAFDEPTASLDRAAADTVIAAITTAARHGCAILVASHDPAVIAAASSRTHLD
jgi:ABC-type lipoprotein export system ATPase subunit